MTIIYNTRKTYESEEIESLREAIATVQQELEQEMMVSKEIRYERDELKNQVSALQNQIRIENDLGKNIWKKYWATLYN